jgi:cell division protein FtsB
MALANKSLKAVAEGERQKRNLLLGVMVVVMSVLLFSFFFGEMGLVHFGKMKEERSKAQIEIVALKRENSQLLYEIEALKADPFYIELLARDRLGLARPGDLTYEFHLRQ